MSIAPLTVFQRFFRTEARGGLTLICCAGVALVFANSRLAEPYLSFWETPVAIGIGAHSLVLELRDWINDGLMALFFLLVGLEIKRELLAGELSSVKQAALPVAAAIGGMIVPAAIYLAFNPTGAGRSGWGIPMATDIAFALGALALIAPKAPTGAKVFLTALAIVDDMGAVFVIAVFYSETIAWDAVGGAALIFAILIGLNVGRVRNIWPYLVLGVVLWWFVHESGVHATIAGIALALTIPTRTRINAPEFSRQARSFLDDFDRTETGDLLVLTSKGQQESLFALEKASEAVTAPILRLEHALHSFSAFVIMPLFALANAGMVLGGPISSGGVSLGVLAGLIIGKPLGVMAATFLAVRSGIAKLPDGLRWSFVHGCAWLAGIGFTMSLFIAMLAFEDPALLQAAKLGILAGSAIAGGVAMVILKSRSQPAHQ